MSSNDRVIFLTNTVAQCFREIWWDADCHLITEQLEEIVKKLDNGNDDESEFHGYMEELHTFFKKLTDLRTVPDIKDWVNTFIGSLDWGNFELDEEDSKEKYMSFGSMYYNKLQWIIEGSSEDDIIPIIIKLRDAVPALLDEMEKLYATK